MLYGFPSALLPGPCYTDKSKEKQTAETMTANALAVTTALLLALGFWLMGELKFLIPYRHVLLHQCGSQLLVWFAVLFVNVFAAVYAIQRKFFLKDAGRKLSHVDKQVLAGQLPSPSPLEQEEAD